MKALGASVAAIGALSCLCLSGAAEAGGRAGPAGPSIYSPTWRHETVALHLPHWRRDAPSIALHAAWGGGSALVAEAARYIGSGKFTPFAGPWCADSVSAWLRAVGKPPLPNRMAASALSYGPRGFGAPGELVVMRTRREYAGHVGIVERMLPDGSVEIISGNWGRRVARAIIPRGMVTAFVRVR